MRLAVIALVVLVAAGCLSHHDGQVDAEVLAAQAKRIEELEQDFASLRKKYEELQAAWPLSSPPRSSVAAVSWPTRSPSTSKPRTEAARSGELTPHAA